MGEVIHINGWQRREVFVNRSGNGEVVKYDLHDPCGRVYLNMATTVSAQKVFEKIMKLWGEWPSSDTYVDVWCKSAAVSHGWYKYEAELKHAGLYSRVSNKKMAAIEGRYTDYEKSVDEFYECISCESGPYMDNLINFLGIK